MTTPDPVRLRRPHPTDGAAGAVPAATAQTRRRVRLRWYVGLTVLAVLLGTGLAGTRLAYVHHTYGTWSWSVPPAPPVLWFHARRYLRWDGAPTSVASGYVRLGGAPDGGAIFGPSSAPGQTPTALEIQTADGGIVGYALSGGP